MKGFKELVNKLKGIKNIEIILAVAIGIIILVIYFFPSENKNKNQQTESGITINTSSELTDEQKLKNVLSEIKGAGRIEVMITYESSPELVPAISTDTQETTNVQSGQNSTTESQTVSQNQNPITISKDGESQALILVEKKPKIRGVIVVAEGAADLGVKLNLYSAVQTALQVDANKVDVFEMNKN